VSILGTLLERRSLEDARWPLTSSRLLEWLSSGQKSSAGIAVSETSAMKVVAVYRAVALVSGAIASLPLQAFRADIRRTPYFSAFIREPHWDMTPMELWETVLAHLLLWGNAYAEKHRDASGLVRWIHPLAPSRVKPKRVTRSAANPWGKDFEITYDDGHKQRFTPDTILHVRGPSYNDLEGLSPIGVAREALGLGIAAEKYGARMFNNDARPAISLTHPQTLSDPARKNIEASLQARQGVEHAGGFMLLEEGMTLTEYGFPPQDAQYIESRKFTVTDIARLYGVPPHLLSDVEKSTSWGTGIEQQAIGFIAYTLRPWLTRLEQRLSKECLTGPNVCQFDTADLQRGDEQGRADAATKWISWGVKTRNEVRVKENLAPDPGGDHFMVPMTHAVLDETGHPIVGAAEPGHPHPEPSPLLADTEPVRPTKPSGNGNGRAAVPVGG
jgi:HK97 family phage portal protein